MLADGLFRIDGDRAVLFGSRRRSTGVTKFPPERPELMVDGSDVERVELSTEGTLYTFTTQQFPPPLPYRGPRTAEDFTPYAVGFIELPEGLLVETLLVGIHDFDELSIGQPMTSTVIEFTTADGDTLLTYAFEPVRAS